MRAALFFLLSACGLAMEIGQQGEKVAASYLQCGKGINCKVGVVVSMRIVENSATYEK